MSRSTRRYFLQQTALAGGLLALTPRSFAASANEQVNMGIIGLGWRGGDLLKAFSELPGVTIAGICDPDSDLVDQRSQEYPQAKTYSDLRQMLDSPDIDAVAVATCNHWHCLAAIWAMQAGKHVYVEKPLSNALWEGEQVVKAATKYDKICQVGTQQRSAPMQAEIKSLLHDDKLIGPIDWVRVNRFGLRASVGKRDTPLEPPKTVDYNIWLGPAQDQPLYRDKFHYDWHWDWNTGAGEMGNWGVHIVDDVRNNIFRDSVAFPQRVAAAGGRFAWHDAGNTPNIHFAILDTGTIPVVIGLSNIAADADHKVQPRCTGPGSGYIAYCEAGRLEGQRGNAKFFDSDGKVIKEIRGTDGMGVHQQNFIDAIRNSSPGSLNAPVEVGHHSSAWCNFANYAYRVDAKDASQPLAEFDFDFATGVGAGKMLIELSRLIEVHDKQFPREGLQLGPVLRFDAAKEQFTGKHADAANKFLRTPGREKFVVPEVS
ncbi:MAG: Gfo/Idh/MocA family oxidoreductase [Bythopirellula sp.]|nr:Gfo/Idh/MocA family oxidoreductase [Bythopirellula sp.]